MASELFKAAIEDAQATTDTTTTTEVKKKDSDPDPYCCTPPDEGPPDE